VKVVTNSDLTGPKCPLYPYAFGTIKTIEVMGFRVVEKTVVDKRTGGVGVMGSVALAQNPRPDSTEETEADVVSAVLGENSMRKAD
jgi:hypothetical protein